MIRMNLVTNLAFALVIIGALNWGLIGFFAFDLVAAIFGSMSMAARIVYALVGLSALCVLAWRFLPQKAADAAPSPRT
jgi:uncharacterized membrane protein YuzA (DUF378 family)